MHYALLILTEYTHEAVVQLLLNHPDMDGNSKDSDSGQSPLSWAAANGYWCGAVVRLLLERADVNVNWRDRYYGQLPLS
jgi:ankyrin repeat protein